MSLKNQDNIILKLYAYIWKISKKDDSIFKNIRIPQTVIIKKGEVLAWFFNSKKGGFLKKRRANLNLKHLRRKFLKGKYIPAKKFFQMFKYYLAYENKSLSTSKKTVTKYGESFVKSMDGKPKDAITMTKKVTNRITRQNQVIKMLKKSPKKQKKFFGKESLNHLDLVKKVSHMFQNNQDEHIEIKKKVKRKRSDYVLYCPKGVFNCKNVMLGYEGDLIYATIKTERDVHHYSEEDFEIYFKTQKHIAYYIDIFTDNTSNRPSPNPKSLGSSLTGGSGHKKSEFRSKLVFLTEEKLLHLCLEVKKYDTIVIQKNVSEDLSCLSNKITS